MTWGSIGTIEVTTATGTMTGGWLRPCSGDGC
jgi:hypothetical protein